MRTGFWKMLQRCLIGSAAGALLCSGTVRADDNATSIEDLKRRIEALEKQNTELRKSIEVDVSTGAAGAVTGAMSRTEVEKMVETAIAAEDAKKKEEAKKAEDAGHKVGSDLKMTTRWNQFNGFTAETANKDFKIHIGGRFNVDSVWWTQDAFLQPANQVGAFTDGSFFRRLRLQADGQFWEVYEFDAEFAFENVTNNIVNVDSMWVGIKEAPFLGTVRIGQIKVPQGFESLSSSKALTFLERSALFDTFWNEFGQGVFVTNTALDEHMTWGAMGYRTIRNPDGADFGDGEYAAAARVTALPWYANEGRCLAHLGASVSWRRGELPDPGTGGIRSVPAFRTRPSMRDAVGAFGTGGLPGNANRIVNTGAIQADSAVTYAAEFLTILGAFSLQAEATAVQVNDPVVRGQNVSDLGFYGYYVTASYFLTGENRAYDRRLGRCPANYVSRINTPFWAVEDEDCNRSFGRGAWEVAARYAWVNLDDQNINGGKFSETTLGVNWYLTYNMKLQFQYINTHRWDVGPPGVSGFTAPQRSGDIQGFGVRTVLEF